MRIHAHRTQVRVTLEGEKGDTRGYRGYKDTFIFQNGEWHQLFFFLRRFLGKEKANHAICKLLEWRTYGDTNVPLEFTI